MSNLRRKLKFARDESVDPFTRFPDSEQTVGEFANQHMVYVYQQKLSTKKGSREQKKKAKRGDQSQ